MKTLKFSEYIESNIGKPFQWGERDCYTLVRRWLDLKYKDNKLPTIQYKNRLGAIRASLIFSWLFELEKNFKIEYLSFKDLKDEDLVIENNLTDKRCIQTIHLVYDNKLCIAVENSKIILIDLCLFSRLKASFVRIKGILNDS